ncbi:GxxExxY protein [Patescibacteria group bacterium]|nr:GxxExxY protein [Patescibacteria group bacterium]MBU1895884.1 GxxExxY protein [Patescibacteria group bacterium]
MNQGGLIYEELSYKLRGILFQVHNELGRYRNEKQFCDAISQHLLEHGIMFEREKILDISFEGERRGRCRLDFMVEDKIIIEVKTVPYLSQADFNQCKRYLVSGGFKLCLLVNFRSESCIIRRVLNPNLIN